MKSINIAGHEINAFLAAGIVVFIVLVAAALQFHLGPTKIGDSGLKELDLEIFKKIGGGVSIDSKEDAAKAKGETAKSIEKAIGTLRSLNENLEGQN